MADDIEKKVVQIELEVDTKTVDSSKNPYQKWIFECLYILAILFNNMVHGTRRTQP